MKLTTHLHLMPGLGMSGAIPPFLRSVHNFAITVFPLETVDVNSTHTVVSFLQVCEIDFEYLMFRPHFCA
jgi:hypothetical protein